MKDFAPLFFPKKFFGSCFSFKKVFGPLIFSGKNSKPPFLFSSKTSLKYSYENSYVFIVCIIRQWTHQSHFPQQRLLFNLQKFFLEKLLLLMFFEKSLRPLFSRKKSLDPPNFFRKKVFAHLSMVPARVPHKFWPVPYGELIRREEGHNSFGLPFSLFTRLGNFYL